jgi:FtsH-binding integral membrane protein
MTSMAASLFAKTFLILGFQLAVTWISTVLVMKYFTGLYHAKSPLVTGETNEAGELDLELDRARITPYVWLILIVNIGLFIVLLSVGRNNLSVGIPVFTLWSIVTGVELALVLMSVDENLGSRVLGLSASIVFACALIAIYSGIDFSFLGGILFIALCLLLLVNILRLFVKMASWEQGVTAFFGVLIFTGYLLFDFNRLAKAAGRPDLNTWPQAMELSISIYLDIINLFLQLLEFLSEWTD